MLFPIEWPKVQQTKYWNMIKSVFIEWASGNWNSVRVPFSSVSICSFAQWVDHLPIWNNDYKCICVQFFCQWLNKLDKWPRRQLPLSSFHRHGADLHAQNRNDMYLILKSIFWFSFHFFCVNLSIIKIHAQYEIDRDHFLHLNSLTFALNFGIKIHKLWFVMSNRSMILLPQN